MKDNNFIDSCFCYFKTEFHPGVPWKGLQNIDPENDPDVTPGSVPTGPTINTTIQDVNRYLLKSGGKANVSQTLCISVFTLFPFLPNILTLSVSFLRYVYNVFLFGIELPILPMHR